MISATTSGACRVACNAEPADPCACAPQPEPGVRVGRAAATASAVVLGACVACCTLPFALPAVVLAGMAPVLALLESSQTWATPLATVLVLAAWAWTSWRSALAQVVPSRATLHALSLASMLLLPALAWPWIEPFWLVVVKALAAPLR